MIPYDHFFYIYPPRAIHKILPVDLDGYEGDYIAQPKYNGSCAVVFTNGIETHVYNRHKEKLTNVRIDLSKLHTGNGWCVLTGEYLNKNKKDENGQDFNHHFIIWDMLVFDNHYMIGYTTETRLLMLEEIFPAKRMYVRDNGELTGYEHILTTAIPNIYRAPAYTAHFEQLYKDLIATDLYEGIVLKKLGGTLQVGFSENNNSGWQAKIRKETKIYKF